MLNLIVSTGLNNDVSYPSAVVPEGLHLCLLVSDPSQYNSFLTVSVSMVWWLWSSVLERLTCRGGKLQSQRCVSESPQNRRSSPASLRAAPVWNQQGSFLSVTLLLNQRCSNLENLRYLIGLNIALPKSWSFRANFRWRPLGLTTDWTVIKKENVHVSFLILTKTYL